MRQTASLAQPIEGRNRVWLAATVWAVGLTALLCDHFEESRPVIVSMHALFAGASSVAICRLLLFRGVPGIELHLFVRLVSRWVYILLYLLAVVRVGLNSVTPVHSLGDFQFYIVCCVVPLWVARAIALKTDS